MVLLCTDRPEEVELLLTRTYPACVIVGADFAPERVIELTRAIKSDAFTAIVPIAVLLGADADHTASRHLEAGADEVCVSSLSEEERILRLEHVISRADRDVSVHPTTRLPGTNQIERDIGRRLAAGDRFAVCYADLDHFKEFNDRYGYNNGDRVILLLSRILHDLVRALAPGGFVGHIGGDDFIYILPLEYVEVCCDEIIQTFDELIPYQYSVEDRRAGFFLGKDRRGSIHRIPLMSLSVGIVTNQFQSFDHTTQVSELAAEMKGYAKSLPGSVYVVDRRHHSGFAETATADAEEVLAMVSSGAVGAQSNP